MLREIDLIIASCASGLVGFWFGMMLTGWYFFRK